jgi:hypothetical protein
MACCTLFRILMSDVTVIKYFLLFPEKNVFCRAGEIVPLPEFSTMSPGTSYLPAADNRARNDTLNDLPKTRPQFRSVCRQPMS